MVGTTDGNACCKICLNCNSVMDMINHTSQTETSEYSINSGYSSLQSMSQIYIAGENKPQFPVNSTATDMM